MNSKDDFIELITESTKTNGFDELTSRLVGILFIETKPLSLDELMKKTKYSLSGISTAVSFLERMGIVKKIKKPKSRKVYVYMEKNIASIALGALKKKYRTVILPSKEKLPIIIKNYEKKKSKSNQEELKIIKKYYKQVCAFEGTIKIMLKLLGKLEKK